MKAAVLAALIAAFVGFGIGRAASFRHHRNGVPPANAVKVPLNAEPRGPATDDPEPGTASPVVSNALEANTSSSPGATKADPLGDFFNLILPLYADDAYVLRKSLFSVTLRNARAQEAVLDIFLSLEDPAVLEDYASLLTYPKDPKFVSRLAQAFGTDANSARRAVLASALGHSLSFPEAQPTVESILGGMDAPLQLAALKWLKVESITGKPEVLAWVTPSLRTLAVGGDTVDVRVAATRALKGDTSDAGTGFLLDRILQDPNVEVQNAAISSLPLNILTIVPPMAEDQLSALWRVFGDPTRNGDVRTNAAHLIQTSAARKVGTLSDEQRRTLTEWIESRKKDDAR